MQRDPTTVGRTNVMVETFAGVINSFVDPISWKTMVSGLGRSLQFRRQSRTCNSHTLLQGFTLVTLSFLIILTNSALWNLRSRTYHEPPQPLNPPTPNLPQPPQPPHVRVNRSGGPEPQQIAWDAKGARAWW